MKLFKFLKGHLDIVIPLLFATTLFVATLIYYSRNEFDFGLVFGAIIFSAAIALLIFALIKAFKNPIGK